MNNRKLVEFCGAFQGRASLRKGETLEEFGARVEAALQKALDGHASRYDVTIGIDYGDLRDNVG